MEFADCPNRKELDTLWRRIDQHEDELKRSMVDRATMQQSINLLADSQDKLRVLIAEGRGEDRQYRTQQDAEIKSQIGHIQQSIASLCTAEAKRQQTLEDRARYWKWGLSAAGVLIAALALLGRADAHPALLPKDECIKPVQAVYSEGAL